MGCGHEPRTPQRLQLFLLGGPHGNLPLRLLAARAETVTVLLSHPVWEPLLWHPGEQGLTQAPSGKMGSRGTLSHSWQADPKRRLRETEPPQRRAGLQPPSGAAAPD